LSQVLNDVIAAGLSISRVLEYGADPPFLIGIVATRRGWGIPGNLDHTSGGRRLGQPGD
jgi:hypothetical protein